MDGISNSWLAEPRACCLQATLRGMCASCVGMAGFGHQSDQEPFRPKEGEMGLVSPELEVSGLLVVLVPSCSLGCVKSYRIDH